MFWVTDGFVDHIWRFRHRSRPFLRLGGAKSVPRGGGGSARR
jgi:hypothetical protein